MPIHELIGALGLPGALAALAWAVYGGIKLSQVIKNGRTERQEGKTVEHQIDLALTKGFDQLRRDLETKITMEAQTTRKDIRNALSEMVLDLELFKRTRRRDDSNNA